jgi:hypothetical protein
LNGADATVTGIDPFDGDCLVGSITQSGTLADVRWDDNGLARNRSDGSNIIVKGNEEIEGAVRAVNAIKGGEK